MSSFILYQSDTFKSRTERSTALWGAARAIAWAVLQGVAVGPEGFFRNRIILSHFSSFFSRSRVSQGFLAQRHVVSRVAALALGLVLVGTGVAQGQTISATVAVGNSPNAVAINPVTNKTYVVNNVDGTVSVIDDATNDVTTVTVGGNPLAIAVNPATDKIYVGNQTDNTVSVIDGATNVVTTVTVGLDPDAIAVDSVTNTIYVANKCGTDSSCGSTGTDTVSVIDGANNTVTSVDVGTYPVAIAANPVTNEIYVVNEGSNNVSVIDGASGTVTPLGVGYTPDAVTVDPATNRVFVANKCGSDPTCASTGTISVIDGTNLGQTVSVGNSPSAIAVNPAADVVYVLNLISGAPEITMIDGNVLSTLNSAPAGTSPVSIAANPFTDQAYVANAGSDNVTLVSGTSSKSQTITVGNSPEALAINPVTNKIYVANQSDGTVSVIDGTPASFVTAGLANETNAGSVMDVVNAATNKIYVLNQNDNSVSVLDGATNSFEKTFTVGTQPMQAAVDPVTDKIYVTNAKSNTVSVIDGSTDTVATTVNVGVSPEGVAVNPVTNKIYVANWCDKQASCSGALNTVSVINGATDTVSTTVTVGSQPYDIAVNPATNKIYVLNLCGSDPSCTSNANVSVIDGRTDTVIATVPTGISPTAVAVDPAVNKIYVANGCGNDGTCSSDGTVSIIDGATNNVTTLAVGPLPQALAVNPAGNEIDVLNFGAANNSTCSPTLPGSVWAINASTDQAKTAVNVGACPHTIAVNPSTNRIYVVNGDGTMSVINGITHTVETALATPAGTFAMAINPSTNELYAPDFGNPYVYMIPGVPPQPVPLTTSIAGFSGNVSLSATPTFTFTTSSTFLPTAPPIQHVYYQVDTWQGPWLEATGSAPDFTGVSPQLTRGTHIVYAFATDGEDATSTGPTQDMIGTMSAEVFTVTRAHTVTTLTADSTTVVQGNPVTFTASVAPVPLVPGTPTGTVTFMDGTTKLGTGTLDSGGSTTFTTSALAPGAHSITAVYGGDSDFAPSTSTVATEQVLATTTTTLSPVTSATYGASVTLTATVTSSTSGTPTGTVTFMEGTTTLGTGTLNGSGVATYTTSALTGGSHSLTASYGGDTNFAPSTSTTLTVTVAPASTTTKLTSSASSTTYGGSITLTANVSSGAGTPTGTVTFFDGTKTLGTGTPNSSGIATFTTSLLSGGSHSLTASYGGDTNFATSTSATVALTVNTAATTASVASSMNPSYSGDAITLTAAVTSKAGTPTGTVTFDDGSTKLGTGTLDSSGKATFSTSSLATGSHSITAAYGGSTDFASSTSAALSETVKAAAFTLSIPSASATVQAGENASFGITVTPEGDMTSAISFACSGLPSEASCSFTPATVTPGTSTTKDTLTISTTAPSTSQLLPLGLPGQPNWPLFAALGLLPGLALLATRKRHEPACRKLRRLAWAVTLALALGMTLSACGGGSSSTPKQTNPGTPAGTYSVTVKGTAGSQTITTKVNLTVQ